MKEDKMVILESLIKKLDDKFDKIYFNEKEIFNTGEAAEFLVISKKQLYKLMRQRVIPYSQPGGKLAYFQKHDLLKYATQNRQKSNLELKTETANYLTSKTPLQ